MHDDETDGQVDKAERELKTLQRELEDEKREAIAFNDWAIKQIRRMELQVKAGLKDEAVETAARLGRGANVRLAILNARLGHASADDD